MSNNDTDWLAEPHAQAFFMQFPLPLAMVGHDGNVTQLNHRFNETMKSSWLQPEQLRPLLQRSGAEPGAAVSFRCEETGAELLLRTVSVGDNTIMVLQKSIADERSAELAALQQQVHELEQSNILDRQTGAWNRSHFDRVIAIEMGRSLRYHQPVSLILIGVDHFQWVNDAHGRTAGDAVLRELVKLLNASIRTSDSLFRWSGGEFAILATCTSFRGAGILAEILRNKVAARSFGAIGNITISLGVAEYVSGESEEDWCKRADTALYDAKNGGRNRVMVDEHDNADPSATVAEGMLHLTWHEAYNCGQPIIDWEHQGLFDLGNALMSSLFTQDEKPEAFSVALENLLTAMLQHFADEEGLLAKHNYADLEAHAQAHAVLVERAFQLRDSALGGAVKIGDVVDFLVNEMVARHMLKMDRQFAHLFAI